MSAIQVGFKYIPSEPDIPAYTVLLTVSAGVCSDVATVHRRNDPWFIWDGLWETVRQLMLAGF